MGVTGGNSGTSSFRLASRSASFRSAFVFASRYISSSFNRCASEKTAAGVARLPPGNAGSMYVSRSPDSRSVFACLCRLARFASISASSCALIVTISRPLPPVVFKRRSVPGEGESFGLFRPAGLALDSLRDSRSRSCAAFRLFAYASVSITEMASPLKMRYARSFTKVRNRSRTFASSVAAAAPFSGMGFVGLMPGDVGMGAPCFRMTRGASTRVRKSSDTPPPPPALAPSSTEVAFATTPTRFFRVSILSAGTRSRSRRMTYRRSRYPVMRTAAMNAA